MDDTAAELRDWAARCAENAKTIASEFERHQLLRKSEALNALAETEDWLAGHQFGPSSRTGAPCQKRKTVAELADDPRQAAE